MPELSANLRRDLERAIVKARDVAEAGARVALEALTVHEGKPGAHLDGSARTLRLRLRAHARQLGDRRIKRTDSQEIDHLVHECAYEHWHRMLFARFLAENDLLVEPDSGVSVTLDEVEELAREAKTNLWTLAGRYGQSMLPEVFRADDPVLQVPLAREDQLKLEKLLDALTKDTFTAGDSLGWCYQFWQAKKKEEVNAAGNKIGADELPSVTQLFTEDYMVDFLLDNTLGAWNAGKVLAANPKLAENAQNEDELRSAVALPRCPWKYLRFIKGKDGKWTPAAGMFDGWPKSASALRALDPCMGSGHFVVALFERLVALRMAEEELHEAEAVSAVISDNLFGLEIDLRCTQIAAFNVALAAWRRVGYGTLPPMNLACSGLAPNTSEEEWLKLAGGNEKLENGMARLYQLFENAHVLGSLINPRAGEGDLLVAAFHELQPLLEKALAQETKDDTAHEMAVTARGLAKAAEILAGQFTLVATNFPFLGLGKMTPQLASHIKENFYQGRQDLSSAFLLRAIDLLCRSGSIASVSPSEWTFAPTYREIRRHILDNAGIRFLATLGNDAFTSKIRANPLLGVYDAGATEEVPMLDVAESNRDEKSMELRIQSILPAEANRWLEDPDCKLVGQSEGNLECLTRLQDYADARSGLYAGDIECFERFFWEVDSMRDTWDFLQGSVSTNIDFGGRSSIVLWEREQGRMFRLAESVKHLNHAAQNWRRGKPLWDRPGAAVSLMGDLSVTIYSGERYSKNCCAIVPKLTEHLEALVAYCMDNLGDDVRAFDRSLKVDSPKTLLNLPFDLAHWQKVAAKKYLHGLPKPFSSDPTQWLFNGHPTGADQPLHVAVARLLGYQWPRQTGSSFPDCPALGPDGLESLTDKDGIVSLNPVRGEAKAADRLREMLRGALGHFDEHQLVKTAGKKGSKSDSIEAWLRDEFFEQHCDIFHQRPFIWHIWDGRKDGFHSLVNYHRLAAPDGTGRRTLEALTHGYLGDWITRQRDGVAQGEAGADGRLAAALELQGLLEKILAGEPPYDIFVRWNPLHEQPIGWEPDINDGVRLNIRPLLMAKDVGRKGAGILRFKPNIKWTKDRGKEPQRENSDFPWFWSWDEQTQDFTGGNAFDGNRWNDLHYTNKVKLQAREAHEED